MTETTGPLFEPLSAANTDALEQLRELMSRVGFAVGKRPKGEATLRAYPVRYRHYPLLNPRFAEHATDLHPAWDAVCLVITVHSKGLVELDAHLQRWASTADCAFVRAAVTSGKHYVHGDFLCRLTPNGSARGQEIDWRHLETLLRGVLAFLRAGPGA
jgi:hypothetical protein